MLERPSAPANLDSATAERLRSRFYRHQGVMQNWGAQLTVLDLGHVEIQIPISDQNLQHRGYVHGGVIAALGDNVCGLAYASLLNGEEAPLTVELKINYVAPSIGELLIGRGSVMHCSERLGTVEGEIYRRDSAGNEYLSASVLATMIKVPRSDARDGA